MISDWAATVLVIAMVAIVVFFAWSHQQHQRKYLLHKTCIS